MSIQIREVKRRRDIRSFINLPAAIHKNHKNWVPPIYMDDRQFFNPKKNEAFSFSDTILLLAFQGKKPVGRIMGIINHKYNDAHNEQDGRFCFLETYENFEIAQSLIKYIEDWARSKGMKNLVGPLGFSDKDPQGLQIEGYDKPVVIATNCNLPYLVDFVEKSGFSKKIDLIVHTLHIPEIIPEFYKRIHERAQKNNSDLKLINFKTRKQMKPYVRPVFTLMNEAFKDIYAYASLTEKEMSDFANRYLMILDPRFLKVIEKADKEVVAFILSMPDISEGIRKCKGRLLPFGILQVFRAQKKTNQLNLLLGAIRPDYRNAGLDTMMGVSLLEEAKNAGIEYIDSHLQLETNTKMHAEMERVGGKIYKRFRIFMKAL
jgi:GNAT superfamily N-acetyltransferase